MTGETARIEPRQYDVIELVKDVANLGMKIPAGAQGRIVELRGTPVESVMVEFDYDQFGDAFLVELDLSLFKHIRHATVAAPPMSRGQTILSWFPFVLPALGGLAGIGLVQGFPMAQINPMYAVGGGILAGFAIARLFSRMIKD
ncbi:hypothetical protein RXV86_06170 [Alisedimentitalea sp. MJ-SS2]|uniref:hypothetical protein n=1 Tax=Aliisedimentitalea sp. MJ-SS2 TaxID=3049795 RepID=UPI00291062E2|nr:hypothetical protein [Alisedimentitalea sp. MJ-SS2]MDU8926963.1 hypothetical protein [Alisedimentitalea sp. MJ-SS2]